MQKRATEYGLVGGYYQPRVGRGSQPFKMCVDPILVLSEAITNKENLERNPHGDGLCQDRGNRTKHDPEHQDQFCDFGKHPIGECTRSESELRLNDVPVGNSSSRAQRELGITRSETGRQRQYLISLPQRQRFAMAIPPTSPAYCALSFNGAPGPGGIRSRVMTIIRKKIIRIASESLMAV
jgi:hypothetical protein